MNSEEMKIKLKNLTEIEPYGNFTKTFDVSRMISLKRGAYVFLPLRNTRLNDEFIVRIFIQTSSEEM